MQKRDGWWTDGPTIFRLDELFQLFYRKCRHQKHHTPWQDFHTANVGSSTFNSLMKNPIWFTPSWFLLFSSSPRYGNHIEWPFYTQDSNRMFWCLQNQKVSLSIKIPRKCQLGRSFSFQWLCKSSEQRKCLHSASPFTVHNFLVIWDHDQWWYASYFVAQLYNTHWRYWCSWLADC